MDVRIRRAANAGLRWVEMWGWSQRDMRAIRRALDETGASLNCLTLDPFAPIVDERAHDTFVDSVDRSCRAASDVRCPFVVVLAGDALPDVPRLKQRQAIVDGLRRAGPLAESHGVTLLLENLNSRIDHLGHYLDTTPETLDIIDEVDHRSVRMLYDLYHSAVMGERPEDVLAGRLDRVAHIQVADVPGRHEPGTGTIGWHGFLGWLSAQAYHGRLGLEYIPTGSTRESMTYVRAALEVAESTAERIPSDMTR